MLKIFGTAILAVALPLSVVAATAASFTAAPHSISVAGAGWDAAPNGAGWD
jgi:hypothetical protein